MTLFLTAGERNCARTASIWSVTVRPAAWLDGGAVTRADGGAGSRVESGPDRVEGGPVAPLDGGPSRGGFFMRHLVRELWQDVFLRRRREHLDSAFQVERRDHAWDLEIHLDKGDGHRWTNAADRG